MADPYLTQAEGGRVWTHPPRVNIDYMLACKDWIPDVFEVKWNPRRSS